MKNVFFKFASDSIGDVLADQLINFCKKFRFYFDEKDTLSVKLKCREFIMEILKYAKKK